MIDSGQFSAKSSRSLDINFSDTMIYNSPGFSFRTHLSVPVIKTIRIRAGLGPTSRSHWFVKYIFKTLHFLILHMQDSLTGHSTWYCFGSRTQEATAAQCIPRIYLNQSLIRIVIKWYLLQRWVGFALHTPDAEVVIHTLLWLMKTTEIVRMW